MKWRVFSLSIALCTATGMQAQTLDRHHLLLDGSLSDAEIAGKPYVFNDFKKAVAQFADTVTLYVKPWVYWVDDPDDSKVAVGPNGGAPIGMTIHAKKLHFIGLSADASDVVFASQRGQTQGAIGNFTMFDFRGGSFSFENMTMGNFCNVDLDYPRRPELSRKKRNATITQAHVGYVHGDSLMAKNVRFISRLNLNPLNGAKYADYENCHFESTDDALTGNGIYRHCTFFFFGNMPFYTTRGRGALFFDCDFYVKGDAREMFFCKAGGPLALYDCRYHAPEGTTIGWTRYPQPWLRCYQKNFTLNGRPYIIGSDHPQNTIILDALQEQCPPRGTTGGSLLLSHREAELTTPSQGTLEGSAHLTLSADAEGRPVRWNVEKGFENYVSLELNPDGTVLVRPTNTTDETVDFCVIARTSEGYEGACHLTVHPAVLPPPVVRSAPKVLLSGREARIITDFNFFSGRDESQVVWFRSVAPVGRKQSPVRFLPVCKGKVYSLSEADAHHELYAVVVPKSHRSAFADSIATKPVLVKAQLPKEMRLSTDFSALCSDRWQPEVAEGFWTIDGFKPADTAEFPWSFSRSKPMWVYGEGYNGAKGKGLLQAQRGARLMYTPLARTYQDMSLTLKVDPTKMAGQGFGSATGQYLDVCLKFDTRTLTGYGLRIIRTTKHGNAVDFLLVAYQNGQTRALTEPVSATCYRTGCTISIDFIGETLRAHVETTTPKPSGSDLPHTVNLNATVPANTFGGIAIQHTGSCGESTTMLHELQVDWR